MPYLSLDKNVITEGESITLTVSKPSYPSISARIGFSSKWQPHYMSRGYEIDLQGWGRGWTYDPREITSVYQLIFESWESQKTITIPTKIIKDNNGNRSYRFYYIIPSAFRGTYNSYYDEIDVAIKDIEFQAPTNILLKRGSAYISSPPPAYVAFDNSYGYVNSVPGGYALGDIVSSHWLLNTEDPDNGDSHSYSLVEDSQQPDNQYFRIQNRGGYSTLDLKPLKVEDAKSSYTVRVRSTDLGGLYVEKDIPIKIYGLPGAPTKLEVSTSHINGYASSGTAVATLSTSDPDLQDTHIYTFVSGTGDTDNNEFSINCDQLVINSAPDRNVKDYYSLRIQAEDPKGLIIEKSFGFVVNYLEAPPSNSKQAEWTQLLGTHAPDYVNSIAIGKDGQIYIAGNTFGDLDGKTNSGEFDAFLSRYSSTGSREWTKLLGTSGQDRINSISTGIDGAIYVAGDTVGDAFISKYTSDGKNEWTQVIGTQLSDSISSISSSTDGSVYVVGHTNTSDHFISKYTGDGLQQWIQMLGSADTQYEPESVSIAKDGAIYIAGGVSTNQGYDDFISKYTSSGLQEWTQLVGTENNGDSVNSVSVAPDGSIYVAGSTVTDLDGQVH
jgi:hypothetical protein